jgi:hypothetical protein
MQQSFLMTPSTTTNAHSLRRQLGILAEMVASLETQTGAGQRHTMSKVVAVLAPHVHLHRRRAGDGIERTVEQLAEEARRPSPDAPIFRRGAEFVISLLASGASA